MRISKQGKQKLNIRTFPAKEFHSHGIGICLLLLRLRPKLRELRYNSGKVQKFTDLFLNKYIQIHKRH